MRETTTTASWSTNRLFDLSQSYQTRRWYSHIAVGDLDLHQFVQRSAGCHDDWSLTGSVWREQNKTQLRWMSAQQRPTHTRTKKPHQQQTVFWAFATTAQIYSPKLTKSAKSQNRRLRALSHFAPTVTRWTCVHEMHSQMNSQMNAGHAGVRDEFPDEFLDEWSPFFFWDEFPDEFPDEWSPIFFWK